MTEPCFIFINANCCQGKGLKKWAVIRNEVLQRLPGATEIVTQDLYTLKSRLAEVLKQPGDLCLVSAGGDGSIHQMCNELIWSGQAHRVHVGAIGLGSSNDFLKPFTSFVQNCPVRINMAKPLVCQDVGKVLQTDDQGFSRERYFVINASFGVTAAGNGVFNEPGPFLKWLKKTNTDLAIAYAAVSTIMKYRNTAVSLRIDGHERSENVSNINILKIPYVSGSLCYRQDIRRDDGRLGLNMCTNMSKMELLKTLLQLEKGVFTCSEKTYSSLISEFELYAAQPLVFECDGETDQVRRVVITVLPKVLKMLDF